MNEKLQVDLIRPQTHHYFEKIVMLSISERTESVRKLKTSQIFFNRDVFNLRDERSRIRSIEIAVREH